MAKSEYQHNSCVWCKGVRWFHILHGVHYIRVRLNRHSDTEVSSKQDEMHHFGFVCEVYLYLLQLMDVTSAGHTEASVSYLLCHLLAVLEVKVRKLKCAGTIITLQ